MEVLGTVINAVVVAVVGLALAWLGRERFDAQVRRIDGLEQVQGQRIDRLEEVLGQRIDRLEEAQGRRIDRLEERLDHRIDSLEKRIETGQGSIDAMRSDLTQVALAVGVRRRATNA